MRGFTAVALACGAVCALASPAAATLSPRAAVIALVHAQDAAYNARNWKVLYSYFGPRFKSACPYPAWEHSIATDPQNRFPEHTVVTNVRLVGNVAYLAYEVYWHKTVVDRVFPGYPDKYVRVGGRWYDEIDGHTNCT